ncbi:mCG145952, partial [Mus musculus]
PAAAASWNTSSRRASLPQSCDCPSSLYPGPTFLLIIDCPQMASEKENPCHPESRTTLSLLCDSRSRSPEGLCTLSFAQPVC